MRMGSLARSAAALGGVVIGVTLAARLLASPWTVGHVQVALALVLVVVGVLATTVLTTPHAPWRGLRAALAVGMLVTLALILTLLMPPTVRAEQAALLRLTAVFLGAAVAAVATPRWPTVAMLALGALALHGAWSLGSLVVEWDVTSPLPAGTYVLATLITAVSGAAWLVAAWQGRSMFARRRRGAGTGGRSRSAAHNTNGA
jgi:hypothetical protein